jgi:hypothetical protein
MEPKRFFDARAEVRQLLALGVRDRVRYLFSSREFLDFLNDFGAYTWSFQYETEDTAEGDRHAVRSGCDDYRCLLQDLFCTQRISRRVFGLKESSKHVTSVHGATHSRTDSPLGELQSGHRLQMVVTSFLCFSQRVRVGAGMLVNTRL